MDLASLGSIAVQLAVFVLGRLVGTSREKTTNQDLIAGQATQRLLNRRTSKLDHLHVEKGVVDHGEITHPGEPRWH